MSSYKQASNTNSKSIDTKKENNPLSDNASYQSNQKTMVAHNCSNQNHNIPFIPLTFGQSKTQSKKTITVLIYINNREIGLFLKDRRLKKSK